MRRKFTEQEKTCIANAVRAAETRTSGQIVPLIVGASNAYPQIDLLGGVIALFGALLLCWWIPGAWRPLALSLTLIGAFVGGLLLTHLCLPVKRALLGRHVAALEVHRRALQAFFEHGLTETRDRTGVLLMISLFERRVQVLADAGIHQKAGEDEWRDAVQIVLAGIREHSLVEGLCRGIQKIGDVLAKEYPAHAGEAHELPEEPIVEEE
jgi:putative membrane protein